MLLGRQEECHRVDRLLVEARAGSSGVLLIRGAPGVGKTSLLRYADEHGRGMLCLWVRGVESESEIGFSSLHELLSPIVQQLELIPNPQAAAVRGALALGPPAGDRLAIAAGTLSVLAAVAERRPLLVLVDDAHWVDEQSADAITFAIRRLSVDRVACVCTHRDDRPSRFTTAGLPEFHLDGIDRGAASALLGLACERQLPSHVVDQLVSATAGNPLALVEAPSFLSEDQLAGLAPIDEPLSVGERLRAGFLHTFDQLPRETRTALLVVAAGTDEPLHVIVKALADLGLPAAALDAASDRYVTRAAERLRWRHPLLRSAIYSAVTPDERRVAHRCLATFADPERRAWHLAAAAPGPDEAVAAALEDVARTARDRGAIAAAARGFERAADMTPSAAERARLLLDAARELVMSGDRERARAMVGHVLAAGCDPLLRADAQLILARAVIWDGDTRTALTLLVGEASLVEPHDPGRAVSMLIEAGGIATISAEVERSVELARRAVRIAQRATAVDRAAAAAFLAEVLIYRGETVEAAALRDQARDFIEASDPSLDTTWLIWPLADMWLEDYAQADAGLARTIADARKRGRLSILPLPLGGQSFLHLWTGQWASATVAAQESRRLAEELGQPNIAAWSHALLARLDAARGREGACREHVARALYVADATGADSVRIYAIAVLGFLELGLGRPQAAVRELDEAARLAAAAGLRHPAVVPFDPDLVEANARANEPGEANRVLDSLDDKAQLTGLGWAAAVVARGRGLLAPPDDLDALFAEALQLHDIFPTPFERARTALCYGERLRRARRLADARTPLRAALKAFTDLGAEPWAARTRVELAAAGDRPATSRPSAVDRLSGQEAEIANLVAGGATNKEVAAHLLLSPKTVEFHLTKIYAKLGVRSRTELTRAVSRTGPAEPEPHAARSTGPGLR
jgi:DNA-binding CsgD family transcriptional regulator